MSERISPEIETLIEELQVASIEYSNPHDVRVVISVELRNRLVTALSAGHAQRQQQPVAWLAHYDGHTAATTNRDTMCQWKDTLDRTITPLYALSDTSTDREGK